MAEKEYIEREAVMQKFADHVKRSNNSDFAPVPTWNQAVQIVEDFHAADVRPVVRAERIGYPECLKYTNAYSDDHIVCSACEECFSILDNDCERFNFCPNCGAQMIGGDDDGRT